MANVKIGAPLTGIRGTIGGITYSENASGPYAKQWAPPVNPQTAAQQTQRGYMAQMTALWAALSGAQQTAWDTFAALPAQELFNSLGQSYFGSGFNWFSKCNIRLARVGRAFIQAVPTQARPAAPTITDFRVTPTGSNINLAIGGTPSADSFLAPNVPAWAFNANNLDGWRSLGTAMPHWLQYIMTASHAIQRFTFENFASSPTLNPTSFTLESFNGATWDNHLTVTNDPQWAAGEFRSYYLPTSGLSSTQWRIHVTASSGGTPSVVIVEEQLFKSDLSDSVIIYPEDNFAASPDYDLILHVSYGLSTAKNVQYPGFQEILAIQNPERQAAPFQSQLEAVFGTIGFNRSFFARLYRQTTEGIRSAPQTAQSNT